MFFNNWHALLRIIVVGALAYVALVMLLRLYGKRMLSQFNAFDFVVTVAMGSTLATVLLTKNVVLVEGILAFVVLLSGQFVVTWLSVRFKWVDSLVKSDPRLLYHDGQYLHKAMKDERVTEEEVISAVREQGMASMEEVQAVILETNGTITTVRKTSHPATAMRSVNGWKEHAQNNNPQA